MFKNLKTISTLSSNVLLHNKLNNILNLIFIPVLLISNYKIIYYGLSQLIYMSIPRFPCLFSLLFPIQLG